MVRKSSFERKVASANKKRDQLLVGRRFSVPPRLGELAILVSHTPLESKIEDFAFFEDEEDPKKIRRYYEGIVEAFYNEASAIKSTKTGTHRVVTISKATDFSIKTALLDETVSSVVFIGHGSINGIEIDHDNRVRIFDWRRAANLATHLKSGYFEQRMCGIFTREEGSVPMGTFVTKTPSKVHAALGEVVDNWEVADSLFKPFFSDVQDLPSQIRELNTRFRDQPQDFE